ncbi:hypothetical protein ACXFAU_07840 [Paenibacillus glucanolyticus]|uniref:hypothetical protein n=1 Tax=Paenibacillus sp. Cedars TaxID=1980674 RepID=UPI001163A97A|nr:hypothetical protein [Paenibacillus sp. Cedars]AWP28924.1 hypothetical protein B9D94_20880 [Paenibacillus sp. Cedars]
MMSRMGKRFVALIIWTGIGILVGMQLGGSRAPVPADGVSAVQNVQQGHVQETQGETTRGNGWGGTRRTPPASESTAQEQEVRASEPEFEPSPSDILLPERSKPPADVLADKTAGLLQQLSDQSIRWVVSMFGSITD